MKTLKITQEQLIKLEKGKVRTDMVAQGFFDGRFKTKSVPNKKAYKRHAKYKTI